MSLATWKEEFYPIRADATTPRNAAAHALRKWIGLLPENLAKHGCRLDEDDDVTDGDADGDAVLSISSVTCSLCHHFQSHDSCRRCPLAIARAVGDEPYDCSDDCREDEERTPWRQYGRNQDPKPMIMWLQRAQEVEVETKYRTFEVVLKVKIDDDATGVPGEWNWNDVCSMQPGEDIELVRCIELKKED